MIHEIKPVLTLNKPIYVRFTVLELRKWLTYDFHYNFIKKHFDKFFDESNKNVIGKMKDVSEGKIIVEFVGLKSKMHSMKNIDGKETNTAK